MIVPSRFCCSPLLIQVTNIPFIDLLPANVEFCPSSALWVPPNLHNTAKVISTNLNYQLNYVMSKDHPTISRLGRYLKCMQKSFCGECSKKTKLFESLSVCVLYACYIFTALTGLKAINAFNLTGARLRQIGYLYAQITSSRMFV